jgi:hypothetical protein
MSEHLPGLDTAASMGEHVNAPRAVGAAEGPTIEGVISDGSK